MVAPASVNTGLEDDPSDGGAVGLSEGASPLDEGGGGSNEDSWDEGANVDSGEEDCSVGEGCSVVCSWNIVGSAVDCSEEGEGACSVVGSWKDVEGVVVGSTVDCSGLDDGVRGVVT